MSNQTITIPVRATMRKEADGSFAMVDAEYMTVETSAVAEFIAKQFGLSAKDENGRDGNQRGRR